MLLFPLILLYTIDIVAHPKLTEETCRTQQSKDPCPVRGGNTMCNCLAFTEMFSVPLQTGKTGSTGTQRPACETVHVYEEALHNLDAAAEKAMQLFSKLANQHVRIEKSREHENQLLAKAAEMLVPIANKIHATAKLAQSANTGSNGNAKMDISTNEI